MTFDIESFASIVVEDANSTVSVPIPVGEYLAVLEKFEARPWSKRDDPSVSGIALDLLWNIDDAGVKAALERDKVTVKQGIMLDLTESGGLDMGKGKNVGLGRLREALGLNEKGRPFSFAMMVGRPGRIQVVHRVDPTKTDMIYSEVKAVAKP